MNSTRTLSIQCLSLLLLLNSFFFSCFTVFDQCCVSEPTVYFICFGGLISLVQQYVECHANAREQRSTTTECRLCRATECVHSTYVVLPLCCFCHSLCLDCKERGKEKDFVACKRLMRHCTHVFDIDNSTCIKCVTILVQQLAHFMFWIERVRLVSESETQTIINVKKLRTTTRKANDHIYSRALQTLHTPVGRRLSHSAPSTHQITPTSSLFSCSLVRQNNVLIFDMNEKKKKNKRKVNTFSTI